MPKVSVIITTYNRAHLIGRAIQSVLDQTFQDFELIVVDDSSTDNTDEVIKEFQKEDQRIRYMKHDENKGGAAARNTGIGAACGEFIAFLDSDDEWYRNKLECDVQILNNNNNKGCIICSTGHTFINEKTGKIKSKAIFEKRVISQKIALRGECFTTNDFIVIRQAAIDIGGFDEKLPARQDWDFWIRITSMGKGIQVPLYTVNKYIMRGDQISAGLGRKLEGTTLLFMKHNTLFSSDLLALQRILNRLGLMHLLNNDGNQAKVYFKKSYEVTCSKKRRIKLTLILTIMNISGKHGIRLIKKYYRLRNPNNYLLWG